MTAKRRLPWNFRTILYALLVILIVVAIIYVIFGPKEEAVRVYSIEEVLTNKQNLVNTVITIEGNYESQDISIVPPTTDDDPNPTNRIQLDLSNIPNATSDLRDGVKYQFTGTLLRQETGSTINFEVILKIDSYDEV
jgi:hypothetical protein